jgi:SAM-dependent methyltransferase
MVPETPTAGWRDPDQVGWYLGRVDKLAPRVAGEDALRSTLPARPYAMLDLGCGDGRVTAALALDALRTLATALAVDISAPTLEQARGRFQNEPRVTVPSPAWWSTLLGRRLNWSRTC